MAVVAWSGRIRGLCTGQQLISGSDRGADQASIADRWWWVITPTALGDCFHGGIGSNPIGSDLDWRANQPSCLTFTSAFYLYVLITCSIRSLHPSWFGRQTWYWPGRNGCHCSWKWKGRISAEDGGSTPGIHTTVDLGTGLLWQGPHLFGRFSGALCCANRH